MITRYVQALLWVPPRKVAELYAETIETLCVTFLEEDRLVQTWINEAIQQVPLTVLTDENKASLVETVADPSHFRLNRLQYELNLLAKRSRSSAIRQ
mgnify:CR=1 FL=1